MNKWFGYLVLMALLAGACSPQRNIGRQANRSLLNTPPLDHAHVGISLYDPWEKKFLYNYQGDRYFVPASNTKIVTCYAGMKYLGDSLPSAYVAESAVSLFLMPAGDPTLLHPDYPLQPVIDLMKQTGKKIFITDLNWKTEALGSGWAWSDYNASYMPERSPMPVYGNVVRWVQENTEVPYSDQPFEPTPMVYTIPEIDWKVRFNTDTSVKRFYVERSRDENVFHISQGAERKKEQDVPFITYGLGSALGLLADTVGKPVESFEMDREPVNDPSRFFALENARLLRSQPTDSMLKPMMHRSDNFFAEQTLLMASQQHLQQMNERLMIDTLLKTDLGDLPHRPRWADGSGLSRYNLFTPQDFVVILDKMQQEFGMDRLKVIFPTGGRGTLSSYYRKDSTYIYAKTGTLSGVVALSGYLYTKKNKMLIFSVLVNNHNGSAVAVRRAVEAFLVNVRNRY